MLEGFKNLMEKMPSDKTLQELVKLAPLLKTLPSEPTLKQLLTEIGRYGPILETLHRDGTLRELMTLARKLPDPSTMAALLERIKTLIDFLDALKGAGQELARPPR